MDKTLNQIFTKLAVLRGEKSGDWGAQIRSKRELAERLAEKGWPCSVRTIEEWVSGRRKPNAAAQVLLNQIAKELTKETNK